MNAPAPQPSGGRLLDPGQAQMIRRRSDVVRAQALLSVAQADMSVWDVLQAAAVPAGRPLLRLSLRQLLLAQPGVGLRSQTARVQSLMSALNLPKTTSTTSLSVQWLLDPRANGRRMLAFIDVMDARTEHPPWAGFPFTPPASAGASVLGAFA